MVFRLATMLHELSPERVVGISARTASKRRPFLFYAKAVSRPNIMLEKKILNDSVFKSNYCTASKLAELLDVPESKIALYTDRGILPYVHVKVGRYVVKYYDKEKSRQQLKHIRTFREKGKTIKDLQRIYRKDYASHRLSAGFYP